MAIQEDPSFPQMSAASGVSPTVRRAEGALVLSYFVPGSASSAVVQFVNVRDWSYGYPNDEGLDSHPLYGMGLKAYQFHVGQMGSHGERAFIASFHDGTLTVFAERAVVLEAAFEGEPGAALDAALGPGDNRTLDV